MISRNRELPAGTLVHQQYEIIRVLGSGGFGITYQAHDRKSGQSCALKEYMPVSYARRAPKSAQVLPTAGSEALYERFLDKFLQEARAIYRFSGHPNIVRVHHLFCENNTAYYAMELLTGMGLDSLLRKNGGCLCWQELCPILRPIAGALQTIHENGMIHCDISPENIYLTTDGTPKLLDFGTARVLSQGSTVASSVILKNGYAPPEQRFGGQMGAWTDEYALAVTIYRCITGTLPPYAEDRLKGEPVQAPSALKGKTPSAQWEQALLKAMAVRREDRFANVRDFWQALDAEDCAAEASPVWRLEAFSGTFAGSSFPLTGELRLGIDSERNQIVFPAGSPGISRSHLRLWLEDGRPMAMDMGSTYGTCLNRRAMTPGLAYPLRIGDELLLGDGQCFCLPEPSCTD